MQRIPHPVYINENQPHHQCQKERAAHKSGEFYGNLFYIVGHIISLKMISVLIICTVNQYISHFMPSNRAQAAWRLHRQAITLVKKG